VVSAPTSECCSFLLSAFLSPYVALVGIPPTRTPFDWYLT
jgi:hypothetical protein